ASRIDAPGDVAATYTERLCSTPGFVSVKFEPLRWPQSMSSFAPDVFVRPNVTADPALGAVVGAGVRVAVADAGGGVLVRVAVDVGGTPVGLAGALVGVAAVGAPAGGMRTIDACAASQAVNDGQSIVRRSPVLDEL